MEIIKKILEKPLDKMKNSFVNIALPLVLFSEPLPPNKAKDKDYDPILMSKSKAIPQGFTIWDTLFIKGPMTVN